MFINLKSVQVVYDRFACFVSVLLLANFWACWLLQRKDGHGGDCQVSRGWLGAGLVLLLSGCSERESSGQKQGPRGFHSVHPRDSSALLCCQTTGPGDEWDMPGLQEARGDCSSDMCRTPMGSGTQLGIQRFRCSPCWKTEGCIVSLCQNKNKDLC